MHCKSDTLQTHFARNCRIRFPANRTTATKHVSTVYKYKECIINTAFSCPQSRRVACCDTKSLLHASAPRWRNFRWVQRVCCQQHYYRLSADAVPSVPRLFPGKCVSAFPRASSSIFPESVSIRCPGTWVLSRFLPWVYGAGVTVSNKGFYDGRWQGYTIRIRLQ